MECYFEKDLQFHRQHFLDQMFVSEVATSCSCDSADSCSDSFARRELLNRRSISAGANDPPCHMPNLLSVFVNTPW